MTTRPPAPRTASVVSTETHGPVLVVTMNRPAKRNALNAALREALTDAFQAFEAADDLRVAILTGAGSAFCAGADLTEMADAQLAVPPAGYSVALGRKARSRKVVIAAVNGPAFAGGFQLVQSCHLCVASLTATFAISEAKVGRGSPWAAPLGSMLPQRVVTEMLVTGESLDARRMYELGFVNRVTSPERLLPVTRELAEVIATNAPLTVGAGLALTDATANMGSEAATRMGDLIYAPVYASEDAQEGPRAFREKRAPNWTAR